jgi:hypothetical protein
MIKLIIERFRERKKNLLLCVLIGESTRGPFSTQVVGLGVGRELKHGSLSELSVGDDL